MKRFYLSKLVILCALLLGLSWGCFAQTTISYSGSVATYTVPAGVSSININAKGAQGGGSTSWGTTGGQGAIMSGNFIVSPGQVLKILVGQQGLSNTNAGGGGGGTYVWDNATSTPLIIAGGGGGGGYSGGGNGVNAVTTTSGTNGLGATNGGGSSGNGATTPTGYTYWAGGGAGWNSGGNPGSTTTSCGTPCLGGSTPLAGGAGGTAPPGVGAGGFGGGGGANARCTIVGGGGGGGYSGGGAAAETGGLYPAGGGGGSYNTGTGQTNTVGRTGNGEVVITVLGPTVTSSPSSLSFGVIGTGLFSSPQTVTLTGGSMTSGGSLTITPPSGFQVSLDGTTWSSSAITYTYSGTSFTGVTLHIRFNPTAVSSYSGNVTITGGGLSSAFNIAVSGTGATPCASTPSSGTATASPSSGTASTSITLNLTGGSTAGSIMYQWQSSPDNTTWTNIAGATTVPYTFTGLTANTYFRVVSTCLAALSSGISSSVLVTNTLPSSCTISLADPGGSCVSYALWIIGFNVTGAVGSISDALACNSTGYQDRTSLTTTFNKGSTYTAAITTGTGNAVYTQMWIDFNSNGTFETTESVGGTSTSFTGTSSQSITIPSTVPTGTFKMRVVLTWYGSGYVYPTLNPCMTGYSYGEARDYKVTIQGSCTAPAAITGTASACIGGSSTLASATSGGTWTTSNIPVAVVNASTGVVTGLSSGTTLVSYTMPGGCQVTTVFTVNAKPTISSITPSTTSLCTDGSVTFTAGTASGIGTLSSYNWSGPNSYSSTTATPTAVFSPSSTASTGIYSLTVSYPGGGCTSNAATTGTITVNAKPTVASITPSSTSLCTGASLTLTAGSVTGVGGLTSYNWSGPSSYSTSGTTTTAVISPVTTGSAGIYSLTVTYPGSGCTSSAVTTPSITINTAPTLASATNSGPICAGTTLNLTANTPANVTGYSWAGPGTITGGTTATASVVSAPTTATGVYSVTVNNGSGTGCTAVYTTSATVNAAPSLGSVTNNSPVCQGGTLTLNANTPLNVTGYSWAGPATITGAATAAASVTGSTPANSGTYSVTVNNGTGTGCSRVYTISATINVAPTAYIVTGGGSYCTGGTGVPIGLSGSTTGINYQLYRGATPVGSAMAGTGSAISFGLQSVVATYSVLATNPSTTCTNPMTGTTPVSVGPVPSVFTVTGGGNYCSGGTGVSIGVSSSEVGVSYQVYNGSTPVGSVVAGTGSALSIGLYTATGTYSVVANPGSTCATYMTGTASVSLYGLPTIYNVTGGGGYCAGSGGTHVGLEWSNTGVNYQLYMGSTPVGSVLAGTGAALDFGLLTTAATYSVLATIVSTGCSQGMAGTTTVSINPLPTLFVVTGGGGYCSGGTGVAVGLNGSTTGVNYQLYNGTSGVGSPVAGTGSAITFGMQTSAGVYTVLATDATTSCTRAMTASATVAVNSLPVQYTVTGGGIYCAGGTGVTVGLSGSTTGVDYQLYNGSTAVGGAVPGNGSALNFGLVTGTGTYTVMATNASTACSRPMSGSVAVSTNATPTVYTMTGGGSYCSGGTGITVGLSNSQAGISYQLYYGSTPSGSPISGTGAAISFGSQTAAGTYSVLATNGATTCAAAMSGTAVVSVNSLPTAFTVGGGGSLCSGATGVGITLNNSSTGVNYQLYNGGTAVGSVVAGTGSALSFGTYTTAGTYTVLATNTSTACTNAMSSSATVIVNTTPTVYTVTGGGSYCNGGTGVTIGLGGSTAGVNYQLYNGSTATGTAIAGTGAAISFGFQTASGTYTVLATNPTTSCSSNMSGTGVVSINALPTPVTIAGGGNYCAGGSGVSISLPSSASGVNYQLYNGATTMGSPVAGTGGGISFGLQTVAGTYSAVAINSTTGCTNNMTGSVTVVVNPVPVAYTVTGGGNFCAGGTGVTVGLNGSNTGINYQLYNGAATVGTAVAGTGSAITFPTVTTGATYTVLATNTTTTCTSAMSGNAVVTVNSLPTAYTVTGGGNYCSGTSAPHIYLGGSNTGINYQLYNGSTPAGAPVAGNGSALDFGAITAAGTYSVLAVNATTSCTNGMTSTVTITINAVPTVYSVTGGGNICAGSAGTAIGLSGSNTGISYQLYNGSTISGAPIPGTGAAISFGTMTTSGTYSVLATNTTNMCTSNMSGTTTIVVNPLPTVYTVSGGGSYCNGGAGVNIGLSGSQVGIAYQLYNGSTTVGSPMAGTGLSLDFGLRTAAGTYTVAAINPTTTCTNGMFGSAMITVNSLPTVYTVTGGGNYCAGGTGVTIGLSGSQSGVSYQLYNGASIVGSPVTGTGAAISFGLQTLAGNYAVVATNGATCTANMSGSVSVGINSLPSVFIVTGGGNYCSGGMGVNVGLSGSSIGVAYQLYNGSTAVGTPIAGTGSSLSFGLQTTGGTYNVVATNVSTTCTANMSGTATVAVNATPVVYVVTGGGSYCSGGSGVGIGLSGSNSGISYQLYNGPSALGSPVAGTGAALDFGMYTNGGSYAVVATNISTGCTANMTSTVSVVVNPLPTVFSITGGGNYCSGGTGVAMGLSGSASGISYQLYNGSTAVGSPVTGTGSAISFGLQTANGSYSVLATNGSTTCNRAMSGTASVTINVSPTAYTITGGGNYCAGSAGPAVGLSNSSTGVTYQLYNGATMVGSGIAGTGSAISFGAQTAAGVYSVIGTNNTSGCANPMSSTVTVGINALPNLYTITGGGNFCSGGTGITVGLSGSNTGISYQLYNGSTASGTPVVGTGAPISFGSQTTAGSYNVVATDIATTCTRAMTGSTAINVNTLPTVYSVTGGGGYCTGAAGVNVGLSGSTSGISYQLYSGSTATGTPVVGTGAAITFGLQTTAGTYSVLATNTSTTCANNMSGTVSVGVNAEPTVYTVVGMGSSYCAGGTGVDVLLSNSETGVNYQLYNGSAAVGSPIAGTGAMIDFGPQTSGGVYVVVATNATTGCTKNMGGSASVMINPLPTAYAITGGGGYCNGGTGATVSLSGSTTGINYQLYNGVTPVGTAVAGTGSSISFGAQTATGNYMVVATNPVSTCTNNMSGTVTVSINPLPALQTVTGGGNYCAGGTGVVIGLNNSATGINYQLNNGSAVGSIVAGTGGAISFGAQTASGTYSVIATNAVTGCTRTMSGSAPVAINALPDVYTVGGGGNFCSGGTGVSVTLNGSTVGTSYQLYNGATAVGTFVPGTGSPLDFGMQTAAGTYTVLAIDASTLCTSNMTASAAVVVNALPIVHAVTGGGNYCSGSIGVPVGLANSNAGISYRLYNGSTPVGSAVTGSGAPINFGFQTAAGTYSVVATNISTSCSNDMGTPVTVSVTSTVTPSVTITHTGASLICHGVLTAFTANPVNGGTAPTYQWQVNGVNVGLGAGSYSYVPVDGDVVSVLMSSNATCAMPTTTLATQAVSVSIHQMPVASLTVTPGDNVCQGTAVTFSVTPVFGGSAPTYTWYKNSAVVSASNVYTLTPTDGDVIYCKMTSNFACRLADSVSSPTTTMDVDTAFVPVVNILANPGTNVAAGQSVTLTAVVTNAGSNPSYQWILNNGVIPSATTSTFTSNNFNNNDSISCIVTTSGACASMSGFNSVKMKVSTGVTTVISSSDVKLMPNPNKGEFIVRGTLGTTDDQELQVEVTNMLGQVVYSNRITVRNGDVNERIQLNNTLANGMYMLSLRSGTDNKVFHFVMEQ